MTTDRNEANRLVLRVELRGISPPIWRRVQVTTEFQLIDIHHIFQLLYGWSDSHNFAFIFQGYQQIHSLGSLTDFEVDRPLSEALSKYSKDISEFEYHYGHYSYARGFAWKCRVFIEPASPTNALTPICLDGARASPPEDVGDAAGYRAYLQIIGTHMEKDEDRVETWLWGYFDPESFDRNRLNDQIINGEPGESRSDTV